MCFNHVNARKAVLRHQIKKNILLKIIIIRKNRSGEVTKPLLCPPPQQGGQPPQIEGMAHMITPINLLRGHSHQKSGSRDQCPTPSRGNDSHNQYPKQRGWLWPPPFAWYICMATQVDHLCIGGGCTSYLRGWLTYSTIRCDVVRLLMW